MQMTHRTLVLMSYQLAAHRGITIREVHNEYGLSDQD